MTVTVTTTRRRIAFAHDWLVTKRGGEAVLDAMIAAATTVGDAAALYTMFDNGLRLGIHADLLPRFASVLQSLPFSQPMRRWLLPAYGLAVRDLSLKLATHHATSPINLLVTSSSAAVLGIEPPSGVAHVCYMHAPARYIRSLSHEYSRGSAAIRIALDLFAEKLRDADRDFARGVTEFLANSRHTAAMIKNAYGRDSTVLYPPVRTDFYTPGDCRRDDFWLVAGALEPYKRVDLAIEAARLAGRRLIIAGNGSCLRALRAIAHRDVTFVTDADDDMMRALFRRARVLLHPQVEDFGIVAVEAQACGLPVAAFARGGAVETVEHNVTGIHFDEQTAEQLAHAAEHSPLPDDPNIRAGAMRFEPRRFAVQFESVIRRYLG
jgi:glycosyltransferase involved in cell wall biosynthesis